MKENAAFLFLMKNKRACIVASLILAALLFVFFVPIRLKAAYQGTIYAFAPIEESQTVVTAVTFSGREYPVSEYKKSSDFAEGTPSSVIVQKGLWKGTLSIEPIAFQKYALQYDGTLYEGDSPDADCISVSAIFADNFEQLLDRGDYSVEGEVSSNGQFIDILLDSKYGRQLAGTKHITPFSDYLLSYNTPYAGDSFSADAVTAEAVFADGSKRDESVKCTVSDSLAKSGVSITVSGRYGNHTELLRYISIRDITAAGENRYQCTYSDGTTRELSVSAVTVESVPVISDVSLSDESTITVSVKVSSDKDLLYGVYYDEGGSVGTQCLGADYGKGEFTVSFPFSKRMLRQPLRVCVVGGGTAGVSEYRYISNPEVLAKNTFEYPKQASKKGLQVEILSDVPNLNLKHAVINVLLNKVVNGGGISYTYDGSTYSFSSSYISELDRTFSSLGGQGIVTTAVLLMQGGGGSLIYPSARGGGHAYYALNSTDEASRKKLSAVFTFLAERYSTENRLVLNWILGNEIANPNSWNYCGGVAFETYIQNYCECFRLLYNATRSVYSSSHCLISLDDCFNFQRSGCYTGRQVLDAFGQNMDQYGEIEWWIAFHPYNEPSISPTIWNYGSRVQHNIDSQMITMMNLHCLTDYVRETYGEEHHFILSETGFTSSRGEQLQAAAIAYAYRISEDNDMVDSLIIHRHRDAGSEAAVGLSLGLLNSGGGRKQSWYTFKDMDVNPETTDFVLSVVGAESWDELLARARGEGEESTSP